MKNSILLIMTFLCFFLTWNSCSLSKELSSLEDNAGILITEKNITEQELDFSKSKIQYLQNTSGKQIQALSSELSSMTRKIDTKDSMLVKLQQIVKHYGKKLAKNGSVVIYRTRIDTVFETETIIEYRDSMPIYKSEYQDKWLSYSLMAECDTTKLKLSTNNEYVVSLYREKGAMFVDVLNKNPYVKIKEPRAYAVKYKEPKLCLGLQLGYGINNKLEPRPYIGLGLTYKLINL